MEYNYKEVIAHRNVILPKAQIIDVECDNKIFFQGVERILFAEDEYGPSFYQFADSEIRKRIHFYNNERLMGFGPDFNEEHKATLEWLNKITDENYNFFGLEIELYKIGDSKVAPNFKMVCQPDNWSQSISREYSLVGPPMIAELPNE